MESSISKLRGLEDDMKKCFRCSLCKMVPLPVVTNPKYSDCCPANREYHFHGYSGSGKSIMALSLLDGRIKADENLARTTFACAACGYCDVACKFIMDAERHDINMALREHIVDEGFGLDIHKDIVGRIVANGDAGTVLTGGPEVNAGAVPGVKTVPQEKAKVLLFGGCLPDDATSAQTFAKLARLVVHAGVDAGVLSPMEPNSGVYAYWTGFRDAFSSLAEKTVGMLDDSQSSTVVVASGADLGMFRAKYPQYAKAPNARVVHATELLEELIRKKKLKLPRPVKKTVTYHDPCYLGRQSEPPVVWKGEEKMTHGCMTYTDPPRPINRGGSGVYDPPRNILRAIEGLNFVEMFRIREYAFCCGGGGGVPDAYPDLAKSAAAHRIEEARDSGAECIVTACHQCVKNLSRKDLTMPVMDIIDLVFEASGIQ